MEHVVAALLLLILVTGGSSSVRVVHWRRVRGHDVVMYRHAVETTTAVSTVQCGAKCQQRPSCRGFDFHQPNSTCVLNDATTASTPRRVNRGGEGWQNFGLTEDFCTSGGHCLLIKLTPKTWANSRQHCRDLDMDLASLQTQHKFQLVTSIIQRLATGGGFWTSGSDLAEEGKWIWQNTGEPVPIMDSRWRLMNPNNYLGMEHCLELQDAEFNDSNCSLEKPFICEQ